MVLVLNLLIRALKIKRKKNIIGEMVVKTTFGVV